MLKFYSLIFLLCATIMLPTHQQAWAAAGVGRVVYTSGPAWVERGLNREPIEKGLVVLRNDSIITGPRGRVKIVMGDGSKVYVGAKSRVALRQYAMRGEQLITASFNMLWGKARFFVNKLTDKASSFNVRTSTAVLGVRGTEFSVWVPPTPELLNRAFDQLTLADIPPLPTRTILIEGAVDVDTGTGKAFQLTPGNTVDVDKNRRLSVRKTTVTDLDETEKPNNGQPNEKGTESKEGNKNEQQQKETPKNPKPSDAKDIMHGDDNKPEFKEKQLPPPSINQPIGNTPLPGVKTDNEPVEKTEPPKVKVDVPEVDSHATNNAIQTLNTITDVKITPNFVKP